jgi:site-specific recombinase XerD
MLRLVQNPRTVQRAMGHKKLETTMRYAHVLKSESDAAIELIGQHLHQAETERRQASLRVVGGVS